VPDKNTSESSDEDAIVKYVQYVSQIENIDHEEVVQHERKKKRRKKVIQATGIETDKSRQECKVHFTKE